MNDIEILEDMRDNIYGAMQFEDDYQVTELEKKQFNALNLAIKSINRVKELEQQYDKLSSHFIQNHVSKDKIKAKIEEVKNSKENYTFEKLTSEDIRRTIITNLQELLEEDKNEYTYKEIVDYGKNKYFDNIH